MNYSFFRSSHNWCNRWYWKSNCEIGTRTLLVYYSRRSWVIVDVCISLCAVIIFAILNLGFLVKFNSIRFLSEKPSYLSLHISLYFNPFVLNALYLYLLKTENRKVFFFLTLFCNFSFISESTSLCDIESLKYIWMAPFS